MKAAGKFGKGLLKTVGLTQDIANVGLEATATSIKSGAKVVESVGTTFKSVGDTTKNVAKFGEDSLAGAGAFSKDVGESAGALSKDVGKAAGLFTQDVGKSSGKILEGSTQLFSSAAGAASKQIDNLDDVSKFSGRIAGEHVENASKLTGTVVNRTGTILDSTLDRTHRFGVATADVLGSGLSAGVSAVKSLNNAIINKYTRYTENKDKLNRITSEMTGGLDEVKKVMKRNFKGHVEEAKNTFSNNELFAEKLLNSVCVRKFFKLVCPEDRQQQERKQMYANFVNKNTSLKLKVDGIQGSVTVRISNAQTEEQIKTEYDKGVKVVLEILERGSAEFDRTIDQLQLKIEEYSDTLPGGQLAAQPLPSQITPLPGYSVPSVITDSKPEVMDSSYKTNTLTVNTDKDGQPFYTPDPAGITVEPPNPTAEGYTLTPRREIQVGGKSRKYKKRFRNKSKHHKTKHKKTHKKIVKTKRKRRV